MSIKRYKAEEIILKLREADVELGRGKSVPELCRQLAITEATYYRWRKEYGGLRVDQGRDSAAEVAHTAAGLTPAGTGIAGKEKRWWWPLSAYGRKMVLNGIEAGMELENAVLEWQSGVDGTVRGNRMPVVRRNGQRWSGTLPMRKVRGEDGNYVRRLTH